MLTRSSIHNPCGGGEEGYPCGGGRGGGERVRGERGSENDARPFDNEVQT